MLAKILPDFFLKTIPAQNPKFHRGTGKTSEKTWGVEDITIQKNWGVVDITIQEFSLPPKQFGE